MPDDQTQQPAPPAWLSGIGKAIGGVLPYALPAALGAAMGGPMGAAAGLATGVADEQTHKEQQAAQTQELGLKSRALDIEQQKAAEEESLRQATLQSGAAYHQDVMTMHAAEFKARLQQHQDDQAFSQDYRTSMLALAQQGKALQGEALAARTAEQKQALADRQDNNIRARLAGAETLAERAGEHAPGMRGYWEKFFGATKKLTDQQLSDHVKDQSYISELKKLGLSRDDLLNHGVSSDLVDQIYAPPKPAKSDGTKELKVKGPTPDAVRQPGGTWKLADGTIVRPKA